MEQENPENPVGRPSAYKTEFVDQAAKLCSLGATDDEMADFFGIHRSTLYRWKLDHSDFCDSIKSAKDVADERVERSLYQKATGYNVTEEQAFKIKVEQHKEGVEVVEVEKHIQADTTAAIFWLKNRRPTFWRDKQEIDQTLNANVSLELSERPKLSKEEWLATHGLGTTTRPTK